MKDQITYYYCPVCKNLFQVVNDSGRIPICCGKEMVKLIPNTTDGDMEKHVPKIIQNGFECEVQVGDTLHPMTKEHYIEWISVLTTKRSLLYYLCPAKKPEISFELLHGEKVLKAYSYCNIHSLFMKDAKNLCD